MNGYFRARGSELNRELRLLGFNDLSNLEELSEDDSTDDRCDHGQVISLGHPHECSRCGAVTQVIGRDPYCTECNWDSLTDPCSEVRRWAA